MRRLTIRCPDCGWSAAGEVTTDLWRGLFAHRSRGDCQPPRTLAIACPDCTWRTLHDTPRLAWAALIGHKAVQVCGDYPRPIPLPDRRAPAVTVELAAAVTALIPDARHSPADFLAAEVARLRIVVELARRRLAMGVLGQLCGRDRVHVAHAEVTRLLMRACAETHDLLADTRPLDGPALQRSPRRSPRYPGGGADGRRRPA